VPPDKFLFCFNNIIELRLFLKTLLIRREHQSWLNYSRKQNEYQVHQKIHIIDLSVKELLQ